MSIDVKKLEQRRAEVATEMRSMVEAAESEDRGFTDEERTKYREMTADVDTLEERIQNAKQANDSEMEERTIVNPIKLPDSELSNAPEGEERTMVSLDERYDGAFRALIRSDQSGMSGLNAEQRAAVAEFRQQATDPGSAGGFLVPEGFGNRIIETMKAFGGLNTVATTIDTATGANLPFPTNDDTGNVGTILAENAADSDKDLVFGEVVLGAYKYTSGIVRVSVELMQDSAFDMDSFIARKFGQRLGRGTSAHFVNGNGATEPTGLLTAASTGVTTVGAAAITYNEMLDLKHSVDPAYRGQMQANWLFNDMTLKYLKQLEDNDGRPLWMPDVAAATPATLDGDTYVVDQAMPDIATGNDSVAYGDMSEFYIRQVKGFTLIRLVERYAEFHQVGFIAHMRCDSNLMDTAAVKKLTQA